MGAALELHLERALILFPHITSVVFQDTWPGHEEEKYSGLLSTHNGNVACRYDETSQCIGYCHPFNARMLQDTNSMSPTAYIAMTEVWGGPPTKLHQGIRLNLSIQ